MSKKEIIHIGFSKSASTFFQSVFTNIDGVNYIYKSKRFSLLDEKKEQFELFSDRLNIESDEHIILPSYSYELNTKGTILSEAEVVLKNIHNHNSEVKIILVVRNQIELIRSRYSQYVVGGGRKSLGEFVKTLTGFQNSSKDYFQNYYFQIIKLIEHLFGKDSLLVIFYEDLKNNKAGIINDLESFIGCDINWNASNIFSRRKGLSDNGIKILRKVNLALVNDNKDFSGKIRAKVPIFIYNNLVRILRGIDYYLPNSKNILILDRELKQYLEEKFKNDNEKLAEHFKRNLKNLGYVY
ncbi:sulfotransferase domain-containing protein [bacterium]|jgi:hypothetical protein|nr:sulfotransferase domain-containing protein [bacterium]